MIDRLANAGYPLPDDPADVRLVIKYLQTARPKRPMIITQRTGWVDGRFVLEDTVIGRSNPEIIYDPGLRPRGPHPNCRGTLGDWADKVARPAAHSSRIIFGISLALAGPLLEIAGVESGGFHLYDKDSSKGKSTVLIAANSVHTYGARGDLLHWDVTDTRVDELAAEYCDRLPSLDEVARLADDDQTAAAKARKVSFKLASGVGRLRSLSYGKSGNLCRWRILLLSSGEAAIFELAKAAGKSRLRGDQVRFIDVPAVVDRKLGIFESVPKGKHPRELAEQIESGCALYYGTALRKFVRRLMKDRDKAAAEIAGWRKEFERIAGVPKNGWERRFSRGFSLAYAAAQLGIEFKILPWTPDQVARAITSCYKDARQAVPDFEQLVAEALVQVRRKLRRRHRLRDLRPGRKADQPRVWKAHGFLKEDETRGVYYVVKPRALQQWIGDKVGAQMVAEKLRDQGHLITTKRGILTRQVMIPGIAKKRRYYCIRRRFVSR